MKHTYNIEHLGSVDISSFSRNLLQISKLDWLKYKFRQEGAGKVHKDTITIPILYDELFELTKGKESSFYPLFRNALADLKNQLSEKLGNIDIIRTVIVNLPSGKDIPTHVDMSPSFRVYDRIHIPLQTHNDVIFTVGDTSMNMKVGEAYIINNGSQEHGVTNNSKVDRLHMIVDVAHRSNSII
jgi:hypothetical protein